MGKQRLVTLCRQHITKNKGTGFRSVSEADSDAVGERLTFVLSDEGKNLPFTYSVVVERKYYETVIPGALLGH